MINIKKGVNGKMKHKLFNLLIKNKFLCLLIIILTLEIFILLPKMNKELAFTQILSTQEAKPESLFRDNKKYNLNSKFNNLSAIKFIFGTYERKNEEILEFKLYDDKGVLLRTQQIKTKDLEDNQEYILKFKDIKNSKNKNYFFELKSLNGTNENSVAIYKTNENNIMFDLGYKKTNIEVLLTSIIIIVFSINIFLMYYLVKNKKVKKEKIFLIFSLLYGGIILFLMPPFQTPDEHRHFYNSYKFSKGMIEHPIKIPKSFIKFTKETEFEKIADNYDNKVHLLNIRNLLNIKISKEEETTKVNIETTVAMYNPIVYIPQSFGILIGMLLNLPILWIFYLGRILNYLTYMIIVYLAIKKSPEKIKNILLVVTMFPVTVQEAISYSVDAEINAFSFLFISYFFQLYLKEKEKFNWRYGLAFFLGIFIPATAKIPYILFVLLLFGLPIHKFKNKKQYFGVIFTILVITLLINLSWNIIGPVNPAKNMKEQILYISSHITKYIETLYLTTRDLLQGYLVGSVGLLGIFYSLPYIFIYGYLILIILYIFSNKIIKKDYKFYFFSIIYLIGTYMMILTALYVSWTELGAEYVDGIQGRYFIPLIPILTVVLSKKIIILKKENLDFNTNLFLNFGLAYTIILLLSRYYI